MESMKTKHLRLLKEAKLHVRMAAKDVSEVGIDNGIGAIVSAINRGDIRDREVKLSSQLVEAVKALNKANDEINKAIDIVMENEGADKKGEE